MDPTTGNGRLAADARTLLGTVTAADSEKGVTVHITRGQPVELLRQGQFVVIDGQHVRFFGTISGFRLAATDPAVAQDPPDSDSRLVFDTLSRSTTYAEATVPLVTVIAGKAIGGGYVAMASRALGADMVYAWPQAQVSCLSAEASAIIMDSEKAAETASPFEAAEAGFVDEVIFPAETRQRIAGALELAIGKRENRLPKKGARLR
jgi:enoyl-CoA hydratase/carnithine racemase